MVERFETEFGGLRRLWPARHADERVPAGARRVPADYDAVTAPTRALSRARTPELPSQDWQHRAACHDLDPELFFPIGTSEAAMRQARLAKTVCARCPVHVECLRWALASGQDFGVWGGLSEAERRGVRRRMARASR
jgi:WhiB family transcriptional regulator, redox-sensing transcriptional regulator